MIYELIRNLRISVILYLLLMKWYFTDLLSSTWLSLSFDQTINSFIILFHLDQYKAHIATSASVGVTDEAI